MKCFTNADTKEYCSFFFFLTKPFSLCVKKQNPALAVVLTSVIPKLRCIFWYFSEMLVGKKRLSFKFSCLLDLLLFFCHSMELTAKLSYCRLKK